LPKRSIPTRLSPCQACRRISTSEALADDCIVRLVGRHWPRRVRCFRARGRAATRWPDVSSARCELVFAASGSLHFAVRHLSQTHRNADGLEPATKMHNGPEGPMSVFIASGRSCHKPYALSGRDGVDFILGNLQHCAVKSSRRSEFLSIYQWNRPRAVCFIDRIQITSDVLQPEFVLLIVP